MKGLLENAYKGKKVFVTGHTGFKGSWLIKWLDILGAEVKGFALEEDHPDGHYHVIQGDALCQSEIGNINHLEKLTESIQAFKPDFVFHLAAQALVRDSYEDPIGTYQTNVIGTGNVILACKTLDKPCHLILITTDKVYHNNEWEYPYRETDRLGGYDPYSSSKACSELIASSFTQSFLNTANYHEHNKQVATTRAGNVIGGGDWAKGRIIPDIIKGIDQNQDVELRNPGAVRPWQHVLEPLSGYLVLGAKMAEQPLKYAGAWNFGPENKQFLTVEDLTKICIRIWGKGNYTTPDSSHEPHEAKMLQLDISKAKLYLSWRPKLNDVQTFEYTIEWYKRFYESREAAAALSEEQILTYMNL